MSIDGMLDIEVAKMSGESASITVGASTLLGQLAVQVEELLGVPVVMQQYLLHGQTLVYTSAKSKTLAEIGINSGDTLVVMTNALTFTWTTCGGSDQGMLESDGKKFSKNSSSEYCSAMAEPAMTTGSHSWRLRLHGPDARVFVGVCDRNPRLDVFPFGQAWHIHFTSASDPSSLGTLWINGTCTDYWGGQPSSPAYDSEAGLLLDFRIDIEQGVLIVAFTSPDGINYEIEAPKPKDPKYDNELFVWACLHYENSLEFE